VFRCESTTPITFTTAHLSDHWLIIVHRLPRVRPTDRRSCSWSP
jgi:hypothetical protein